MKSVEILTNSPDSVVIASSWVLAEVNSNYENRYTVLPDGTIRVWARIEIEEEEVPEMPRFGMKMVMPGDFSSMTWYGSGPHESYWDRKTSAFIGLYSGTVMEQYTPYITPQENGNKTDVRWVALQNRNGRGLIVIGDKPLGINAHNYLEEDFDHRVTHTIGVPFRDLVELSLIHI